MPFSKYGPGWLCLYHGWEYWNSPIHCGAAVVAFYQTGPCIVSVVFGSSHTVCEVLFLDHWNILWHNIGAICGSFHRWFICNSGGRSRFCSPVSLGCLRHYSTIFVTNRLNRNHFSWIFSKFLTFTLHSFVVTQMCLSPILEHWDDCHIQINIGEGQTRTIVSRFFTSIVALFLLLGSSSKDIYFNLYRCVLVRRVSSLC